MNENRILFISYNSQQLSDSFTEQKPQAVKLLLNCYHNYHIIFFKLLDSGLDSSISLRLCQQFLTIIFSVN